MTKINTIHMGLNTSKYDGKHWDEKVQEVINEVEKNGAAHASWGCTGRTLHCMLATHLEEALPQYDFDIDYDSYRCFITKKDVDAQ